MDTEELKDEMSVFQFLWQSVVKFYFGILIKQTNQQMLVIVGHTLNEGGLEP